MENRRPKVSIDGIHRPLQRGQYITPRKLPSAAYLRSLNARPEKHQSNDRPSPPKLQVVPSPPPPPLQSQNKSPEPVKPPKPPKARVKKKSRWSKKRKALVAVFACMIMCGGFGVWYSSRLLGNVNRVFHESVFSDAHALLSTVKLKGEDQGRVNILLAGDSGDDPGHPGADLTDSIMVLSIDTKKHTGFMLSVPRDLWVQIPGWSHQKINAANTITRFSQQGYPTGGMGQLEQIVQTDLGIPIDYYALIDYSAFKDAVNAVGGITIDVESQDPRGLFDPNINRTDGGPLKLPNGPVTLDGQTALNLARARGDPCDCRYVAYGFPQSDFNRTQHQRQMLVSLGQKARTIGVIANPLKVTQLFDAFGNNVQTDLNLQDVLRLIDITKGIDVTNLQSISYANSGTNALLANYIDPTSGQDALIPKAGIDSFGQLQQYYQQLTSSNPIVKEAPTVVVLNGSGTAGLATAEKTALQAKGYSVVSIANATATYPSTMIVDASNGQKPASKQLLQQLFPGTITTTATGSREAEEAQGYTADFVVVLGQNSTPPPTATTQTVR